MARFWTRLALIGWLLAGFLYAPAMAFGMQCPAAGITDKASHHAMRADAGMHMKHDASAPRHEDLPRKTQACLFDCISTVTGFILPAVDTQSTPTSDALFAYFPDELPAGSIVGPPLEPPIPASA